MTIIGLCGGLVYGGVRLDDFDGERVTGAFTSGLLRKYAVG